MPAGVKFNSDLLLGEDDREGFRALHPKLAFAFDDPELRALFEPIDRKANDAKKQSRRLGVLSVLLVTGALLAASAEMLLHAGAPVEAAATHVEAVAHSAADEAHHAPGLGRAAFAALAALAGLAGAAVGFFGVMFGPAKQHWLERRYLTERMRQLHFQTVVAWAPMIVEAAMTGDQKGFLDARAARTERFKREHVEPAKKRLAAIVEPAPEPDGTEHEDADEAWLVTPMGEPKAFVGPLADELLSVLEELRLAVQKDYAKLKLKADRAIFSSSPRTQARRFSTLALWCVAGLLVLHFAGLIGAVGLGLGSHAAQFAAASSPWVHLGAIWLAIVALAARTLEEGFQSHREEERYMAYGSAVGLVGRRFREAHDPAAKLEVLRELEDVSFEEMVTFLKANHEARFVM